MKYPSFLKDNDLIGITAPSAGVGSKIDDFEKSIENIIGFVDLDPSESIISNERQLEIIKKIKILLKNIIIDINSGITFDAITVLIHDSINLIMELTGENATEEVINKIFSQFCVGK